MNVRQELCDEEIEVLKSVQAGIDSFISDKAVELDEELKKSE